MNTFAARADGDPDAGDAINAISDLKAYVVLRDGVVRFSALSFGVAGATGDLSWNL